MNVSEVRIKLMHDPQDRLLAFCSITFDSCFVIRDLKIIRGGKGPFVAMPSRKLTARCPFCGGKNTLRSSFCNHCGRKLTEERVVRAPDGRAKLYADIAHPINAECRDQIQSRVVESFEQELILSQHPGYVCHYDDFGDDYDPGDAGFYYGQGHGHGVEQRPAPSRPLQRPAGQSSRLDSAEPQSSGPHDRTLQERPVSESAGRERQAAHRREPYSRGEGFGEGVLEGGRP